ncbi:hypothetical protein F2Q69_00057288 [Brassica cretica]|uniref:Uncharacterized protein n=1 Tax=Brassica cretica TaxID=69181 RepID=A0A8S9MN52_BRACR|nr:hypothetical protein F2Q69_00057288 [Brassica cretica]
MLCHNVSLNIFIARDPSKRSKFKIINKREDIRNNPIEIRRETCRESDSKQTELNPSSFAIFTASRRASPSAIRVELTKTALELEDLVPAGDNKNKPKPAFVPLKFQAASDLIVLAPKGGEGVAASTRTSSL